MVRLAGAVFVWLGCTLCGVQAAANLGRHTRMLESLVCGLEQMERELVLSHLPLPDLLERIAGSGVNRVRRELEQWAVQARERQRAYGRVYGMLGITAGSALVIMLV